MVTRVLIIAAVALAGCERKSELYCERHPEDIGNCGYSDAGIDARPPCTSPADCVAPAAVCDLSAGVCVQCLVDADCTDPQLSQCDTETYECKGCSAHDECTSNACLPNGTCGDDTNVAYVDPAGTATTACTLLDPCGSIDDAILTNKPNIKLTGALVEPVAINGISRTFLADPDTTLSRANGGVLVDVSNGATLTMYDVVLVANAEAAVKSAGSTVRLYRVTVTNANKNDVAGINATTSTLTMSRCLVHNNRGGGIETDDATTYNITNSIIVRNGHATSNQGGVVLRATTAGERRFEMNTVVDNSAKALTAGVAGGVACFAPDLPISNNLIVRNYGGTDPTLLGAQELAATPHCDSTTSELNSDIAPYAFIDADAATGPGNYHVGAGSMAIDRGVTSDIGFDFDGQLRPQGMKFDFGADEYKQP